MCTRTRCFCRQMTREFHCLFSQLFHFHVVSISVQFSAVPVPTWTCVFCRQRRDCSSTLFFYCSNPNETLEIYIIFQISLLHCCKALCVHKSLYSECYCEIVFYHKSNFKKYVSGVVRHYFIYLLFFSSRKYIFGKHSIFTRAIVRVCASSIYL